MKYKNQHGGAGVVVDLLNLLSDLIGQRRLVIVTPDITIVGATLTAICNPSTCDERTAQHMFKWLEADLAKRRQASAGTARGWDFKA